MKTNVPAISKLRNHAAVFVEEQGVEHQLQITISIQQGANSDTNEQGRVYFLGNQCQANSDYRGQQGENG